MYEQIGMDTDVAHFLSDSIHQIMKEIDVVGQDVRLFTLETEGRDYKAEFAIFDERCDGLNAQTTYSEFGDRKLRVSYWQNENLNEVIANIQLFGEA
ncbi:hypothetical protein [Weissella viridescens]|uniref:hypothetical protein n=1 Tax=Weissella viridescens TaxID=1629 RepID=UPI003AF1ECDA